MLADEEGLFTGDDRAGGGPEPRPLPGTRDEVDEDVGRGRWQGWMESRGGRAVATIWQEDKRGKIKTHHTVYPKRSLSGTVAEMNKHRTGHREYHIPNCALRAKDTCHPLPLQRKGPAAQGSWNEGNADNTSTQGPRCPLTIHGAAWEAGDAQSSSGSPTQDTKLWPLIHFCEGDHG